MRKESTESRVFICQGDEWSLNVGRIDGRRSVEGRIYVTEALNSTTSWLKQNKHMKKNLQISLVFSADSTNLLQTNQLPHASEVLETNSQTDEEQSEFFIWFV